MWDQSPTKRRQLAGEVALVLKPEDALAAAADCVLAGARDLPAMLRRRLEAACQRPDAARSKARWDWPLGRLLEAVATNIATDGGKACQAPGSAAPAARRSSPPAPDAEHNPMPMGDDLAPVAAASPEPDLSAAGIDSDLRRRVAALILADRHPVARVAAELGIEERLVEQIQREEQVEREGRGGRPGPAQLLAPHRRQPSFLQRGAS